MSVTCLDINGSPLKEFHQWDNNQQIVIVGANVSPVPTIHFANILNKTALVVTPIVEGESLIADVPNILLQQPESLKVYIYEQNGEDGHRTRHTILIPVIPRKKPDNYEYEGNVEFIKVPDGLIYEDNNLYLASRGEIISDPVEITGGGLSPTASTLLISILRAGVYTSDISKKINQLEEELEPPEPDVYQIGDTLYINVAPVTQVGDTLYFE